MEEHPLDDSLAITYYNYESDLERARSYSRDDSFMVSRHGHVYYPPSNRGGFIPDTVSEYKLPPGWDAPVIKRPFFERYAIRKSDVVGYDRCHGLSKNDIEQYNDMLLYFIREDDPTEEDIYYRGQEARMPRNFMPLALFLSSFMEREVNLSLVQLMRSRFGIEMPEFFTRFKPGCQAVVESGEPQGRRTKPIPLNARNHHDKWKPVMLGQAYYAFCAMSTPGASPGVDNPFPPEFFQCWKTLVDNRNVASHAQYEDTDLFDYRKFRAFHSAFSSILSRYLWLMEDIKVSMQGDRHR
ncbi:MAG: hypothetical protein II151_03750 [Bacteroidales bacterium]|nr:hypothetical protein [Bacteroidales bacterium]